MSPLTENDASDLIVRAAPGIRKPPVDLFELASRMGVSAIRRTEYRDGFTDFCNGGPIIYLNEYDSSPRMRFILAHEIAHVLIRMDHRASATVPGLHLGLHSVHEEEFADKVAGQLLLPDWW